MLVTLLVMWLGTINAHSETLPVCDEKTFHEIVDEMQQYDLDAIGVAEWDKRWAEHRQAHGCRDKTQDELKAEREAQLPQKMPMTKDPLQTPAPGEEITRAYIMATMPDWIEPCKKAVEADAYALRWINGWLEYEFDGFAKRRGTDDGAIRLTGDKAEAQNRFGAWVRVNYLCEYDPDKKSVIHAEVRPVNPHTADPLVGRTMQRVFGK
jgi:hypothetical protein